MPAAEMEEFARLLVNLVRDLAVADVGLSLRPDATDVCAVRWRKKMQAGSPASFAAEIIPDCVNVAIFYLLDAIDNGLRLSFTASSGKTIDLTEAGGGEMAGYFIGSGGWRAMYSKQRFNDDFADIEIDFDKLTDEGEE